MKEQSVSPDLLIAGRGEETKISNRRTIYLKSLKSLVINDQRRKKFTNSTNEMQLNFNSLLSLIISLFTRLPCWKSVPPSPWSMTAMIGSRCPEEAEGGAGVTWLGATRTLGTRPASRGGRGWPPATGRLPHVSSFLYICSNLALRSLCFFSQRQVRAGPGGASAPSGSGCT